jgi:hypothetical protein
MVSTAWSSQPHDTPLIGEHVMLNANLILSFAKITFPILLLIPPLITSFRRFVVPPLQLMRYFAVLIVYYLSIVLAAVLSATNVNTLILLVVSAILVAIALFYVIKWTAQEHVRIRITIEARRNVA